MTYVQSVSVKGFCLALLLVCIAGGCFENRYLYLCGIVATVYLIVHIIREHKIVWNCSAYSLFIGLFPVCAFLSLITAVDKGMDVLGILRVLSICSVGMLILKLSGQIRKGVLYNLPIVAGISLALSYIIWFINPDYFRVFAGHSLAGCFGYANAFALFLFLGVIVVSYHNTLNMWLRLLMAIWLIAGLVFTGSKAVFGIAIAYGVMRLLKVLFEKVNIITSWAWVVFVCVLALCVLVLLLFGTSTFWGRLLYWQDMLGTIVTRPFGTGYLGFYYMQPAIQTGVYDTSFLHNSVLQFASDYGWVSMILFITLICKSLRDKRVTTMQKEMIVVMLLHFIFDFDLEYLALWCILFVCLLPFENVDVVESNGSLRRLFLVSFNSILCVVLIYFCSVECLYSAGNKHVAQELFPYNTEWNLKQLADTDNPDEASRLAAKITKDNEYAFLAYEAQALKAAANNVWEQAVSLQKEAVECSKYRLEGYETLLSYMQQGAFAAVQENDMDKAAVYVRQMKEIPQLLNNIQAQTSWLGQRISEQPELELDADILEYLNDL